MDQDPESDSHKLKDRAMLFPSLNMMPGYKRVASLIESEIVAGRIKPGAILPTETALASQLGVNRSTIREGIRFLENSGLVKRVGGKRLMVTVPDNTSVALATSRALSLRHVTFTELWEVQIELEPFCAGLAAERVSGEIKQDIANNLKALEENLNDDVIVIELDIEFHKLVAKASNNFALMLSLEPIANLLFSATLELYKNVKPARYRLLEAHERIAEAIIANDVDAAKQWMARHIHDFRRGYLLAGIDLGAPL